MGPAKVSRSPVLLTAWIIWPVPWPRVWCFRAVLLDFVIAFSIGRDFAGAGFAESKPCSRDMV